MIVEAVDKLKTVTRTDGTAAIVKKAEEEEKDGEDVEAE